jgi:single-stranded-DNA-specific exonuclease
MLITKRPNQNNKLKNLLIGHNEMIVNVLVNRGYDREIIESLLETGYSNELPPYNNLTNVEVGADIISSHIANGSTIWIFGDHDSDGVNSTYILGDAINNIIYETESNATINLKVPERTEGYGLNMNWCEELVANKSDEQILVITVDNGIAADREVAYLLENGIDVLITDHHQPNGHTPQNVFIIDAFHNNDSESNKGLCGAGVAFKLAMTLLDRYPNIASDDMYYRYMIHVAIATITDSMPMTKENIQYVYNGLQLLKDGYGSEALNYYKDYNANTDLTPKDLAFGIGPQLNACGRMNNVGLAIDYLFCEESEVEDLYNKIVLTNDERKAKTKEAVATAESIMDINSPSIVLALNNVAGIAGIIASDLSSRFNKCTIVFSSHGNNKYLIGSARSTGNIHLLNVLRELETDAIVKVGGHAGACGITIKAELYNEFVNALNNALNNLPTIEVENDTELEVVVDDFITLSDINKDNCEALKNLYFFTESNPVFALDVEIVKTKKSNNNPNNMEFTVRDNEKEFSFWSWGIGAQYNALNKPTDVVLVGEIEYKFGKPSFNILNIIPKELITICN